MIRIFAFLVLSSRLFCAIAQDKTEVIIPETTLHYTGTINAKYKLQMNLVTNGGSVTGNYRYFTQKDGLYLKGTFEKSTGAMILKEQSGQKVTGTFEGILKEQKYSGTWYNGDRTKKFPFELSTAESGTGITFTVVYLQEDDLVTVKTITLTLGRSTSAIQTIIVPENQTRGEKPTLYLEDMNFDGYADLGITLDNLAASANFSSAFWLYDPNQALYVFNNECSDLPSPTVDLQHQQINGYANSGCCWHEETSYVFQDGHYYKVYSLVNEVVNDVEKKTVKRWKVENGKTVELK